MKLDGAGVYVGDMHALQGDGEIAGHTCDVAGTVTLQVEVLKRPRHRRPDPVPGRGGPALPRQAAQRRTSASGPWRSPAATASTGSRSRCPSRSSAPGPDLNSATDNGLARAAELLGLSVPEVMNRATIAGAIEIGRHPGVVQVTFRAPADRLEACGLLGYAIEQYGEP